MPGVGNYDVTYTLILRDQMSKSLQKAAAATKGFNSYLEAGGNQLTAMFSKGNIAMGAMAGGIALVGKAIKEAMDFEQMSVQMEVMLGSADKAQAMLKDIEAFAIATPFESSDLIDSTKKLLQFGVAEKKVMPTMKMLGDIAMGDAEKLQRMTLAFGQMSSAGRLMGQDLLQMINAGFNPLQEMSKRTGMSMFELRKEMERGNISVAMVEQAFADATGEGGRFNGMMEKQSGTMGGQWSTAVDKFHIGLRDLGGKVLPQLTQTLGGVNKMMSGKDIGRGYLDVMKGMTQTLSPYGWAWKFAENKIDGHNKKLREVKPTYTSLHDQMKMIAQATIPQLKQGLTNQNELLISAASITETQLTAALDRAQKMYGLTSAQIDVFLGKVREQKKLMGGKNAPLTTTERTTSDLQNQVSEFKKMQDELTGTNKDMKERKKLETEINKIEKEISRREGGKGGKGLKSGGAGSTGSEGTTISSRAPQYFTITIDTLVGTINTKKETFNETDMETKKKVTESLVTALNDTQLIASTK